MLKSRAFTVSFRFYFGLAAAALVGALVASLASNTSDSLVNRVVGPLSLGWKGSVGDHLAYTVLVGLAVVSAVVGGLLTAFRDADPSAEAEVAHLDSVPLTRAPVGTNYWPVIGTFGVAALLVGLAISSKGLAWAGAGVIAIAAFTWTTRAWAERATGDDATNIELYHQVIEPIRLPALAILLVGIMVIGFSRILLTLPSKNSSAAVFGLLGLAVLLGSVAIALKPRLSKSAITLVVFVFGIAVIVGGIIGAARGPREFEKHQQPSGQEQPAGQGG